ncbi:MAG: hypothetical protein V4726_14935 [Verrucomicrobiota bacterium]
MKFESQILVINTVDDSGAVIESPELIELGGRQFISGNYIQKDDEGSSWTSGLRTWIAVDRITTITEVPDLEDYIRRCGIHKIRQAVVRPAWLRFFGR